MGLPLRSLAALAAVPLLFPALSGASIRAANATLTSERPRGSDEIYRRSVEKALDRAREELEGSLQLFVDHSRWEDPWIVEAGSFRVRSTENWLFANQAALNLQTMLGHFEELLDQPFPQDEVRNVYVFPDRDGYNDFGGGHGYHSSIYGSFYADTDAAQPIASYYHPNATLSGMWLTHAAGHMYISRLAARELPTWMEEGLASYFAYWFWAYDYGVEELARLQENGRFVPLPRLLGTDLDNYPPEEAEGRFLELGMLFAYLIHHCEETKSPLNPVREGSFVEYLRKAIRGERLTRHPFHEILNGALPELDQDFRAFEFPRYE